MLRIKFRYKDRYTEEGTWSEQECFTASIKECKEFYGLDKPDVDYQIISVEEVE